MCSQDLRLKAKLESSDGIVLTANISFRLEDLNVALAHPFQESCKKVIKMFTLAPVKRNVMSKKEGDLRMKGVKPSSSSGSHNSFIKPLASSLESFSPRIFSGFSRFFAPYLHAYGLTKIGQQPEEIFAEDGLVFVLVKQFQDLNEIVDATGVLGLLGQLEERVHVLEGDNLLALLLLATNSIDGLAGRVDVAGADEVTNVEAIDLAVTLEVIDLEGELDLCKL